MSSVNRDGLDSLSVPEMLRIMDVATALRQDRELVDEQLNLDARKSRLRDRMIAAANVTGEEVTPAEVDSAIGRYYGGLHSFHEPKLGFSVTLAHLWVRRHEILKWGGAALGSIVLIWWLFLSASGPLTLTGRTHRKVERLAADLSRRHEAIRAVAQDPAVVQQLSRLAAETHTYRKQDDLTQLEATRSTLADLEAKLREEYTVTVVAGADRKSGIDRYFTDREGKRIAGYFLIVEAKRPDGSLIRRHVRDSETRRSKDVTIWGERVPKEVYDRIAADKRKNGSVTETTFAVKRRGFAEEEIKMPGPDGKPIARTEQIVEW